MRAGSRRSEEVGYRGKGLGGISHEVGGLRQKESKRDGVDKEIELLAIQEGSLIMSKTGECFREGLEFKEWGNCKEVINQPIGMEAKVSDGERAEEKAGQEHTIGESILAK